jgi:tetratricopeptide (TPR) repeat protein
MLKLLALLLLPLAAFADDRWLDIRSGPFQVLTNAGDRPGREALNQLEQVRDTVGTALGKPDLTTLWPIRILVLKSGQPAPLTLARDTYTGALVANLPTPRELVRECVRILIDSNARRMSPGIEVGMAEFYSTAQVSGTRITLGQPPPPPERSLDWARMHLIGVDPAYFGKLRVLLYNLQHGADPEPAFRNAFGKTPAELDKQAAAYLAAGSFQTVTIGGRALDPRSEFTTRPAPPLLPQIALADLRPTAAAYQALLQAGAPAVAREGLAFLALRERHTDEARREFASATEAGSTSARCWLEFARLTPDKARPALEKAAALNPAWAEPHVLLAAIESDPSKKLQELKTATDLEPRNAARWRALAEFNLAHNRYPEAAKAWTAAESASVDDAERASIHNSRLAIEQQRLDFEVAERKRQEAERQRDLQRVKDAAMAEVRAAEARANRGQPAPPPDRRVVGMFDGPAPSGKIRGRLTRIDCIGKLMRLAIEGDGGSVTRLLIRDLAKVIVMGAAETTLACGPQKTIRTVTVEYFPKADAKLATTGEVATIDENP